MVHDLFYEPVQGVLLVFNSKDTEAASHKEAFFIR